MPAGRSQNARASPRRQRRHGATCRGLRQHRLVENRRQSRGEGRQSPKGEIARGAGKAHTEAPAQGFRHIREHHGLPQDLAAGDPPNTATRGPGHPCRPRTNSTRWAGWPLRGPSARISHLPRRLPATFHRLRPQRAERRPPSRRPMPTAPALVPDRIRASPEPERVTPCGVPR